MVMHSAYTIGRRDEQEVTWTEVCGAAIYGIARMPACTVAGSAQWRDPSHPRPAEQTPEQGTEPPPDQPRQSTTGSPIGPRAACDGHPELGKGPGHAAWKGEAQP